MLHSRPMQNGSKMFIIIETIQSLKHCITKFKLVAHVAVILMFLKLVTSS